MTQLKIKLTVEEFLALPETVSTPGISFDNYLGRW
ncbi:MAG: hypothetical protein RLZZ184_3123 [Cyanobacteriota bacterium]|jgi:hypothetical protein